MLEVGNVVKSLLGHDSDKIYLVLKLDGDFAYVVDGKTRTKINPKKKRIKHLKNTFITYNGEKSLGELFDFEIATYLKNLDTLHK